MAEEIERRWLCHRLPGEDILKLDPKPMKYVQGYLPSGGKIHERVTWRGTAPVTYSRTVKIGHGLRRQEFVEEIPESVFQMYWPLTEGRRLHKLRYKIPEYLVGGPRLTWEVTDFLDRVGIVLVEMEFPEQGEPASFTLPDWLKIIMIKEVTEDVNYEAWMMGK